MGESAPGFRFWLRFTLLVPAVAVIFYAGAGRFLKAEFFSVLGVGLLVGAAASMLGVLVGFLFGLPRTSADPPPAGRLSSNTNLDQVSDWLTKILVGLGLVQIGRVGSGLNDVAEAVAPGLGDAASAKTFAFALLVYSLITGFLVGYLSTRIGVTMRLKQVEDLLAAKVELLTKPLEPPPTLPPPPPTVPEENAESDRTF